MLCRPPFLTQVINRQHTMELALGRMYSHMYGPSSVPGLSSNNGASFAYPANSSVSPPAQRRTANWPGGKEGLCPQHSWRAADLGWGCCCQQERAQSHYTSPPVRPPWRAVPALPAPSSTGSPCNRSCPQQVPTAWRVCTPGAWRAVAERYQLGGRDLKCRWCVLRAGPTRQMVDQAGAC